MLDADVSADDLHRLPARYMPAAIRAFTRNAVKLLLSGVSYWPVDTGRSKRGFRARNDTIVNTQDYAGIVENSSKSPNRGAARRTIEDNSRRLVQQTEREINRRFGLS